MTQYYQDGCIGLDKWLSLTFLFASRYILRTDKMLIDMLLTNLYCYQCLFLIKCIEEIILILYWLPFVSIWVHPWFYVAFVLLIFLALGVVFFVLSVIGLCLVSKGTYISCFPRFFVLGLFVGIRIARRFNFRCCHLCFVCLRSISCAIYCLFLWIVHSWLLSVFL